jgi:hypothetical protein
VPESVTRDLLARASTQREQETARIGRPRRPDPDAATGWAEVLRGLDESSFVRKIAASDSKESVKSTFPEVLQVCAHVAIRAAGDGKSPKRIAIVLPRSGDAPKWIALMASLSSIRKESAGRASHLPPLKKRDRLLFNRKSVVQYLDTVEMRGETFFKVRVAAPGAIFIPARLRLLFQHIASDKPLSKHIAKQNPDIIDEILNISALGNKSIFSHQATLVAGLGELERWMKGTFLCSPDGAAKSERKRISDLIQCGGVDSKGEVEIWSAGNIKARPVFLGIPNLSSMNEYLAEEENLGIVRIVVIDGGERILSELQEFDDLLDTDVPVLAVLESPGPGELSTLRDRNFVFWTWTRGEMSDVLPRPAAPGPQAKTNIFSRFCQNCSNYGTFRLREYVCSSDHLSTAWASFRELDNQLKQNAQLAKLTHLFLSTLLAITRLLRPANFRQDYAARESKRERLRVLEAELSEQRVWLSTELVEKLKGCIRLFGIELDSDEPPPKAKILEDILSSLEPEANVLIVVDGAESLEPTRRYWKMRAPGCKPSFLTLNELDSEALYECVIVCGWLGRPKMRRLVVSWVTSDFRVLVSDFESEWLRSARRTCSREQPRDTAESRTALLGRRIAAPAFETIPEQTATHTLDLSDFELKLHSQRREELLSSSTSNTKGEDTVPARLIELSDDYYAFLSETHTVPVVTDLIIGNRANDSRPREIPERTVSELFAGDFLLFRESAEGSVIRAVADIGLKDAGKGHLRQISSLWREALRNHRDRLRGDTAAVIRSLRKAGCRTTGFTIRHWLNSDQTIGPREEKTLDMIAAVSGDPGLRTRLAQVKEAIREVRSAHLQASGYLVEKLLEAVPSHLADSGSQSFRIEIKGIGAAIVCRIESMENSSAPVAISRVNRLLRD